MLLINCSRIEFQERREGGGVARAGGSQVARATAPGPARGPRLQSEVKATDNARLIDD